MPKTKNIISILSIILTSAMFAGCSKQQATNTALQPSGPQICSNWLSADQCIYPVSEIEKNTSAGADFNEVMQYPEGHIDLDIDPRADLDIDPQVVLTPLLSAALRDDKDAVSELVKSGADPNMVLDPKTGMTPLMTVVSGSLLVFLDFSDNVEIYVKAAKLLIDAGANVNAQMTNAETGVTHSVLSLAVFGNRYHVYQDRAEQFKQHKSNIYKLIELLIDAGADLTFPANVAAYYEMSMFGGALTPKIIESYAKAGISPNLTGSDAQKFCSSCNYHDISLLFHATKGHYANSETVAALVKHGANVNPASGQRLSALLANCLSYYDRNKTANAEVAKTLIRAGADIQPNDVENSLSYAVRLGDVELVDMIISAGSDVNRVYKDERDASLLIALKSAAFREEWQKEHIKWKNQSITTIDPREMEVSASTEIARLLINAGADIHVVDSDGNTPLMFAAKQTADPKLALELIEAGLDVNAVNKDGENALMSAAIVGNFDAAQAMIEKKADVNAISQRGATALTHALANGHEAIVKLLIDAGANPNAGSARGVMTPLMYAVQNNALDSVKYLITHKANVNDSLPSGLMPISFARSKEVARELWDHGAKQIITEANEKDDSWNAVLLALSGIPGADDMLAEALNTIKSKGLLTDSLLYFALKNAAFNGVGARTVKLLLDTWADIGDQDHQKAVFLTLTIPEIDLIAAIRKQAGDSVLEKLKSLENLISHAENRHYPYRSSILYAASIQCDPSTLETLLDTAEKYYNLQDNPGNAYPGWGNDTIISVSFRILYELVNIRMMMLQKDMPTDENKRVIDVGYPLFEGLRITHEDRERIEAELEDNLDMDKRHKLLQQCMNHVSSHLPKSADNGNQKHEYSLGYLLPLSSAESAVLLSASIMYPDLLEELLSYGIKPEANPKTMLENPILIAALYQQEDAIKRMINHGFNMHDLTFEMIGTILDNGTAESLKLLIDHGADIHIKSRNGENLLMRTALTEISTDMMYAYYNDTIRDNKYNYFWNFYRTNLQFSFHRPVPQRDRKKKIQLLLNAGLNINETDNDGNTALMHALLKKNKLNVQILLEAGADPSIANNKGESPKDLLEQTLYDERIDKH
ncbi:MAG: ankyrin repeat domain-containing protein [Proteobacteria bacterium]|nr:ankyrin repeat domain-containing protein [Pseudomonadota bacterium]